MLVGAEYQEDVGTSRSKQSVVALCAVLSSTYRVRIRVEMM